MIDDKLDNLKNILHRTYPTIRDVRCPDTCGQQNNVLFGTTPDGERAFKFSTPEMANKNTMASRIYQVRHINAPKINVIECGDVCIEEYSPLKGQTLHQAITQGIGAEQINKIYENILHDFVKMARIRPQYILSDASWKIHNITQKHVAQTNSNTMALLCAAVVYLLNAGKDKALFHADITPKNIIVSDDGKYVGLVDMDAVSICNKNFAFGAMAAKYNEIGMNAEDLVKKYEQISTSDSLDLKRIQKMADLNAAGKKLLWQHAQRKK